MDTEDKIAHLKSLQVEIGEPSSEKSTFTPKSTKQELIELVSGLLVTLALCQYLFFGFQSLKIESYYPLVAAPLILTILCVVAEKIYPIKKVQGGAAGLASSFNYFAVNLLFFWLAEAAVAMAMIALVFSFDWRYALFLGYPVILIEWIKRKNNKQNQSVVTTPDAARPTS